METRRRLFGGQMAGLSVAYGLGAVGLGIVGLVYHDFALQWQPVPPDVPARAILAVLSALVLIGGGIGVLVPQARRPAALALALFYALWVLVLHLPRVAATPSVVAAWLGVCEITALAAGGFMIFAVAGDDRTQFRRVAAIAFGLSAIVFGVSHFVYAGFTAAMVPKWLPAPLSWAYATGAGHLLAGIAILTGIRARLAATMEAGMCGAFVLLLHAPATAANPTSHAEWTMLFVALSIAGAAWTMRAAPQRI